MNGPFWKGGRAPGFPTKTIRDRRTSLQEREVRAFLISSWGTRSQFATNTFFLAVKLERAGYQIQNCSNIKGMFFSVIRCDARAQRAPLRPRTGAP